MSTRASKPSVTDQIYRLVRAGHTCIRIVTDDEAEAISAVNEAAMSLDLPVMAWSAVRGVHNGLIVSAQAVPETENAAAGLFTLARSEGPAIFLTLDLAAFLSQDERTLRAWRELVHGCEQRRAFGAGTAKKSVGSGGCVVMIDHRAEAPAIVDKMSVHIETPLPDAEALERVVKETFRRLHREAGVSTDLSRDDLRSIVTNLRGLTCRQAARLAAEAMLDDRKFTIDDLPIILDGKRRLIESEGILEHVDSPGSIDQIGGMARLKRWLAQRTEALSLDAAEFGLPPPRGMLLLGVQGGGKSLCAKAVATAWRRPLLRMDVGRLYDRYIGESERRLRAALEQAEMMAPIILWIDEIEKAFASAASQSSDGGLSRRMFGALLTWMQEHRTPVFLVATANDIEALPPELLRKGRFDEIFFVDLPGDEARRQIFRIHLDKKGRDPAAFDLPALVSASRGFSGAEIEEAIVSGLHEARSRRCDLRTEDVLAALRGSPPLSVTMAEEMQALREWARGRCVPAD